MVGQARTLIVDQGDDGDEQWVAGQALHLGVGANLGHQSSGLGLPFLDRHLLRLVGISPTLVGDAPLLGKALHLLRAEGAEGIGVKVAGQRGLIVAHDAAGDDDPVTSGTVTVGPGLHLAGHGQPVGAAAHLVQPVQQEQRLPCLQRPSNQLVHPWSVETARVPVVQDIVL